MSEVQGITAIDSLYEQIGFEAAGRIAGLLVRAGLPLLVVLGSVAWLFFRGAREGTYRHALAYFFSALLVWFLISPVGVVVPAKEGPRRLESPRFLFHLEAILDRLVGAATNNLESLKHQLQRDRAAFLLEHLTITDADTRTKVRAFLQNCTTPEILAREREGWDIRELLLFPLVVARFDHLPPDRAEACGRGYAEVRSAVREHLEGRSDLRAFLQESEGEAALVRNLRVVVERLGLGTGRVPVSDYLQNVAVARVWQEAASDLARVRRATGGSVWALATERRHHTTPFPGTEIALQAGTALWTRSSMELDARAKRYELMLHAPRVYGIFQMLTLAGFPLAMVFALLPSGWTALVHFGKVFLSVKLWPLFWNLLALFNDLTPEPDARLILPVIYVLIPGVSFLLVNLLAGASASALRIPQGAGMSAGSAAGAVMMAAK